MRISFNRPPFVGKETEYIKEAVEKNGMICGDGPFTKKCSQWMKERFQTKNVLLTTSCTHALEMAAFLADIQPGDEVIMPSYTFVSTADAFVLRGATCVFVDIRPDTMNIDETKIEEAITEKTKAIVPVHYAGVSCAMDEIMAIAKKYNLKVVEDAAQGVNAFYKGKALGTIGDFGCYSFHETKNYSMGEGGAILFQDDRYLEPAEILREKGTMNGMITTDENYNLDEIIPKLKAYTTGNVVDKVTCEEKSVLPGKGKKVALLDLGAKRNIAQSLNKRGCEVTVYPAHTTAEEILGTNPDGIMLSNGPGDPKECKEIIAEIRKLYESDTPIFAICLGHQLMALATGADTYHLKYGHRGGNHPVKDLKTNRVYISSQNHGYAVDTNTLDEKIAKPAFVNVNDGTNEGLEYVGKNIFTVQFHPEACPGPQDSAYLFDRFIEMMGGTK